jgi:hypothetical protein
MGMPAKEAMQTLKEQGFTAAEASSHCCHLTVVYRRADGPYIIVTYDVTGELVSKELGYVSPLATLLSLWQKLTWGV